MSPDEELDLDLEPDETLDLDLDFDDLDDDDLDDDLGDDVEPEEDGLIADGRNAESGKAGWALAWLLGIPLPLLLVVYLVTRAC